MKRCFAFFIALMSAAAFATTTTPISLLNPSGSTAGQAIISTGPTTAPAWQGVTLSGVTGMLTVNKGGTGAITLTPHGVLIGEGTSSVVGIGPGTNGQMLLGVTSADPYWGNNPAIIGGTVDNSPIGNTTASSGKFTTISASSTVSGTGFSTYLASPPAIGGTAAAAGSFTTLSATGLISPAQTVGIQGTTTNNNAQAGSWGEYPSPSNLTAVSLTTNTAANCASIALTAGDWDVQGIIEYDVGTATGLSTIHAGVNTTSATLDTVIGDGKTATLQLTFNTNPQRIVTPVVRVSLASSGTAYIVGQASFSGGTYTCSGFARARRVR